MVENIGMTARAMMNCGLEKLRLVAPRDPWPTEDRIRERLYASASGADGILDKTQIFPDLPTALADVHYCYATSARNHEMNKQWSTPREAMPHICNRISSGQQHVALMFGPERTGLTLDDMTYANEALYIPANPAYSSFNLAQAVLILGYEYMQTAHQSVPPRELEPPASKEELHNFFNRLENYLDDVHYFPTEEMRPKIVRNLRNAFQRAALTEQEVRTWHGVIKALALGKRN